MHHGKTCINIAVGRFGRPFAQSGRQNVCEERRSEYKTSSHRENIRCHYKPTVLCVCACVFVSLSGKDRLGVSEWNTGNIVDCAGSNNNQSYSIQFLQFNRQIHINVFYCGNIVWVVFPPVTCIVNVFCSLM